jgi:hypothetical protein
MKKEGMKIRGRRNKKQRGETRNSQNKDRKGK